MKTLPKNIFVTGIDTNVGKTVVCATLAEALHADYWKPVQSGNTEGTDTATIQALLSNDRSVMHPESYNLKAATVPSFAAEKEGIIIDPEKIQIPNTENRLIIEGAGGLMVHLNRNFMVIDLIAKLSLPVILVSKNYLGSINHTLLSIEAMQHRGIEILGVIYSGEKSEHMRTIISKTSGIDEIGSIEYAGNVNSDFIKTQAAILHTSLQKHFEI